jgi:hypothetical protein
MYIAPQIQHVLPHSQFRDHDLVENGTGRGLIQSGSGNKHNAEAPEDDMEPSAADNLKTLVQECGVSPHKISELLQELPPQRLSDVLIDYYFTAMCAPIFSLDIEYKFLIIRTVAIGPAILSLSVTSEPPMSLYPLMGKTVSERPTRMMFASSPSCSWCLLLPFVSLQNILQEMPEHEG